MHAMSFNYITIEINESDITVYDYMHSFNRNTDLFCHKPSYIFIS